jgi:hypothetical protein
VRSDGLAEVDPADLTPEVRVTVNITPGKPPPGLFTKEQERQLARLEKPFLDHLASRPAVRAKFLSDPLGALRGFSPAAKKTVDSFEVDDLHADPVFPQAPGVKLASLKVNVKRPPAARGKATAKRATAKKPASKKRKR